MLGQVEGTDYDLYFPLFGIPVRVTPWFWLAAVIFGWSRLANQQPTLFFIWVAALFFSILVHEMGHALMAKHYGWPPEVFLYHFGGVARFVPTRGYTPSRSILISFAGPGAGFLLYGVVKLVEGTLRYKGVHLPLEARVAFFDLEFINLWWGLVNLLPVIPLDGGRISEQVCTLIRPRDGLLIALKIAIVASGLVAFYFLRMERTWPAMLFGFLCVQNIQQHQQISGRW
ncbi:MAG: hypothetical protein KDA79_17560 [Planctomycetaceae bacterium]|nr:hypothetical protein [Planctomycetaceae bacterium]